MTVTIDDIGKLVRVLDCPAGAVVRGNQGEEYVVGSANADAWVRSLRNDSERVLISLPAQAQTAQRRLDARASLDLPALRRGHNQTLPHEPTQVSELSIARRDVKPEFQAIPEQCRLQLCLCYWDDVCQKCGALAHEHKSWKPAPGMEGKRPAPEPREPALTYDALPAPAVPLHMRMSSMMAVIRAADVLRENQGFRLGSAAHSEAMRNYDELRAKLKSEEP